MSRWWRAYDEALHDPKLIGLSDRLHRAWFNLLCVASKNAGLLPAMNLVAIELRVSLHKAAEYVTALVAAGLIDEIEPGKFAPHNWGRRQYQSDVSTERVKRFRERSGNVSSDVSETPPENRLQNTDSEQKDSRTVAPATRPRPDSAFDEFWKAYPKREGANPRKPALAAFTAKLKAGSDAADIIAGAKACAIRDREKIGTPYIPQAVRWLRDERWRDYLTTTSTGPPSGWRPGLPTDEELRAKYARKSDDKPDSDGRPAPAREPAGEAAGRAGDTEKLLREGEGVHRDEQLGKAGADRQRRVQSLGDVLSRSLGLDAGVSADARSGADPGYDGPGPMAAVVRS